MKPISMKKKKSKYTYTKSSMPFHFFSYLFPSKGLIFLEKSTRSSGSSSNNVNSCTLGEGKEVLKKLSVMTQLLT